MYSAPGDRVRQFFKKSGAPLTLILISSNLVTLLLGYATMGGLQEQLRSVVFFPGLAASRPWTLFTYPIISEGSLWGTLFAAFMMWWAGSSLERSWGTRWFAGFFFGISAVFAICVWAGTTVLGTGWGGAWAGLWLPTFGVFIAWATLNPWATINLYGVIPIRAAYLAILDILFLWFAMRHPLLGLFAQGGNVAAWAFVNWRPWNRYVGYREPRRRRERRYSEDETPRSRWNPLAKWEERRRRQKIDALFRNSGYDDRQDPPTVH
jgi:hypothetical protein